MGRTVFTTFLKSEFSQENVYFWIACEDYKKTSPSKLATKAKQIYQQYVDADAPNEVKKFILTDKTTQMNQITYSFFISFINWVLINEHLISKSEN